MSNSYAVNVCLHSDQCMCVYARWKYPSSQNIHYEINIRICLYHEPGTLYCAAGLHLYYSEWCVCGKIVQRAVNVCGYVGMLYIYEINFMYIHGIVVMSLPFSYYRVEALDSANF